MTFIRYEADELRRFLIAVDAALEVPASIVVIGGSALALGYGGTATTSDIDTYESHLAAIDKAAERARAETGLSIPIRNSAIAQLPSHYERRLVRMLPALSNLLVRVVDAHDLAASKLVRGNEHDRQQLRQLHDLVRLDLATLIERFDDVLEQYVGDPTEPRLSLRYFVEEVWGEMAAIDAGLTK
jgi:hypothetical protein